MQPRRADGTTSGRVMFMPDEGGHLVVQRQLQGLIPAENPQAIECLARPQRQHLSHQQPQAMVQKPAAPPPQQQQPPEDPRLSRHNGRRTAQKSMSKLLSLTLGIMQRHGPITAGQVWELGRETGLRSKRHTKRLLQKFKKNKLIKPKPSDDGKNWQFHALKDECALG